MPDFDPRRIAFPDIPLELVDLAEIEFEGWEEVIGDWCSSHGHPLAPLRVMARGKARWVTQLRPPLRQLQYLRRIVRVVHSDRVRHADGRVRERYKREGLPMRMRRIEWVDTMMCAMGWRRHRHWRRRGRWHDIRAHPTEHGIAGFHDPPYPEQSPWGTFPGPRLHAERSGQLRLFGE